MLRRFLGHPAFIFSVLAYALLATCLALYFYFGRASQGRPELSYLIRPLRTIIVRTGHTSDLEVIWGDRKVETGVTAAEVVFWNRGQQAVRRAQILKPITIQTQDRAPILDVKIQASSETAGFGLDTKELARGHAILTWKILEPGDGAVIRIIYAGGPEKDVQVDGSVEGQKMVLRLEAPEGKIYRREFDRSIRTLGEVYVWTIIGTCLLAACVMVIAGSFDKSMRWAFLAAPVFLALGVWLIVLVHNEYAEPPFGF